MDAAIRDGLPRSVRRRDRVFRGIQTMRNRYAAMLTAVLALSSANAAAETSATFTVENKTKDTIVALYTGPSSSEEWGSNILDGFIAPGDTIEVTLGDVSECDVDFRFEFKGGEPREFVQQNACKMNGQEFVID